MQIITNQFQKELKKHGSDYFPFLVSYQRLSEYESNSFMWHYHPEIEITFVKKGSMHYRVNNRSFHLKEGDIIFCNSKSCAVILKMSNILSAFKNTCFKSYKYFPIF